MRELLEEPDLGREAGGAEIVHGASDHDQRHRSWEMSQRPQQDVDALVEREIADVEHEVPVRQARKAGHVPMVAVERGRGGRARGTKFGITR